MDINVSLLENPCLEKLKYVEDREERFRLVKEYFARSITHSLYEKMDLLSASNVDPENMKNMHSIISKHLFIDLLLAFETVTAVRGVYRSSVNPNKMDMKIKSHKNKNADEYSICKSYIAKRK